jgi:hypothetical protein
MAEGGAHEVGASGADRLERWATAGVAASPPLNATAAAHRLAKD